MKTLTLLFLVNGSEVLLAMKKRGFGEGRWNGVGGKVEVSETVEQGLVRECQEEIFVTPTSYKKVADIMFHEQHEGEMKDMHVHAYMCTEWEGEPKESEEMAPQWFNKNELPLKDMWPDDEFWLPQVLAGKKLKAEFTLNDKDEIIQHSVAEVEDFDE